jgi:sphingolipid delta-4 desaturase
MFIFLQPAFYALRPMLLYQTQTGMLEIINWAIVLATDYLVLRLFGTKALFYLMVGSLLGLSIHPCAGHFLAEHYVWEEPTETYSYYGPLNFFAFNVGFHVEHHDFPKVPGSRLPKLREMAKEFYPTNPKYQSWPGVMYRFVMDANMGTYNRVVRSQQIHETGLKKTMAEQRARKKD